MNNIAEGNLLLAALPHDVYERLESSMEQVVLPYGQILHHPNETIRDVYFPCSGLISVTITMADGNTTEAGAIGNREMVGLNAFMGRRETNQTEYIVQIPGTGIKIAADPLLKEFDCSKSMRDVMLRYTQAYIAQISQNVACNRLHVTEKRCARWLLEASDRTCSDELLLSQEFISHMLGVRRSSVTETANRLQDKGLIEYSRKKIKITNRHGLEDSSCECYHVLKDEYDRLLGLSPKDNN